MTAACPATESAPEPSCGAAEIAASAADRSGRVIGFTNVTPLRRIPGMRSKTR
ncbi:hypothetical protein [Candidatus Palauibacter sp.]|uniref:hypothetical protein n=1 Tax=Candidatus Palauibacter sp. TaxID=3101350 RepID=UPI003B5AFCCB